VVTKARPALLHVLRMLLIVLLLAVLAQGFVCSLVVLQGGRDETRSADAIVVLYPTATDTTAASASAAANAHLEQALDLYQRGLASHVVLVGDNTLATQEVLLGQEIPETAILLEEAAGGRHTRMQAIANLLYRQGLRSVLLVDEPASMLLDLKMARDLGLTAYGSPISTETDGPGQVMQAGLEYWQYVLLGGS
jgi:uncharacterized SAM-binding protein YcdF (DUF218 family)